jgi:hypothetical protein
MTDLVRTQILLDQKQRDELMRAARLEGKSFSELVRLFLAAQLRQRKLDEMQRVAERLSADYHTGGDLTDLTALDGEDFLHT